MAGKPKGDPIERFWKHVDKRSDNECWLWTGQVRSNYGAMFYNGRKKRRIVFHT